MTSSDQVDTTPNEQSDHPTLERLNDQIRWYGRKSQIAQRWFKALKLAQVIAAALIPLIPVFGIPHSEKVSAVLGLVILIIETVQQLNQHQQNWISYRSTCEALKHEKYLFQAEAGPYAGSDKPMALLADRIEGLISQEHAKWVSVQEQAAKGAGKGSVPVPPPLRNIGPRQSQGQDETHG
jgi:hypothetical protein